MRKILKFVTPIVVLAAGVGSVMALSAAKPEIEKKIEAPRVLSLHVEEVRADSVRLKIRAQGEVSAKTDINLVPEVSGRIISVSDNFAEGGAFTPGSTLIKIDDANYRLAVTSAKARVAEASVRLQQELADAKIKKKQWEEWVSGGDPTPLALNAPQVAQAQAQLRGAEADMEMAQLNLARTNVSVPFKGRVMERKIGVGQYVTAGTQLGRVFATDKVEIRLALTDSQLNELNLPIGFVAKGGNAPTVKLSTSVGARTYNWSGKIVRVNASVDQRTRLVYAIAEVEDPYGAGADNGTPLAVGMYVNAEIEGVISRDAFILPRLALRSNNQVYVLKDGKLQIRTVEVMSTTEDIVLVKTGVLAGDQVVISPVRSVIEGMAAKAIVPTSTVQTAAASR